MTLREYPLPCRKRPSWILPKARETGDNQHLSTRLLGSPSLLWVAEALAAGSPKSPASCSSLHILGIREKAKETPGWRARARQSLG